MAAGLLACICGSAQAPPTRPSLGQARWCTARRGRRLVDHDSACATPFRHRLMCQTSLNGWRWHRPESGNSEYLLLPWRAHRQVRSGVFITATRWRARGHQRGAVHAPDDRHAYFQGKVDLEPVLIAAHLLSGQLRRGSGRPSRVASTRAGGSLLQRSVPDLLVFPEPLAPVIDELVQLHDSMKLTAR